MFQVVGIKPDVNVGPPPSCDVNGALVWRSDHVTRGHVIIVTTTGRHGVGGGPVIAGQAVQQPGERVCLLGWNAEVIDQVVTTQRSKPAVWVIASF